MSLDARVAAVRRFNRFYTREIGVLQEPYLHTAFSLLEARVLYEIAHLSEPTAADVCKTLKLDAGYLSRILKRLEQGRLLNRAKSASDGRRRILSLTAKGQEQVALLDGRSQEEIRKQLGRLPAGEQERVVEALETVSRALSAPTNGAPYLLRSHQPGDMGWVVERHGARYAAEYGWDVTFESLAARVVADIAERSGTGREAGWIAELDGTRVGCVFCTAADEADTAQLRLLLVEPSARGFGVGTMLVDECLRFAKRSGYTRITLWTNDVLLAGRRIYEREGFQCDRREPHHSFGHDLVGEYWSRDL